MQEKSYVTIRQKCSFQETNIFSYIGNNIIKVIIMFIFLIKQYRKKKGLSITQLSDLTRISRSYLYKLENNKNFNVSLDKLYKISTILDVNVKDLFYTSLDIENLRKELHNRISKYGLDSKEVLEISKIIDLLVNIYFKELD